MDFLGIGTGELLLILFLAILFLGPERLVGVAREAGRLLRRARQLARELDAETPPELKQVRDVVEELRTAGNDLRAELTGTPEARKDYSTAAGQAPGPALPPDSEPLPPEPSILPSPPPPGPAGPAEPGP